MGTYYYHLMVRRGWSVEAVQMRAYWLRNERQLAVQAVSDDVLEALTFTASSVQARTRLAAFEPRLSSYSVLAIPYAASSTAVRQTLETLSGQQAMPAAKPRGVHVTDMAKK